MKETLSIVGIYLDPTIIFLIIASIFIVYRIDLQKIQIFKFARCVSLVMNN